MSEVKSAEVVAVKSEKELAAEAKRTRKGLKRVADYEAMLAGPQASVVKELLEEEEEAEVKPPSPRTLARLNRDEKRKKRGGSWSEMEGKVVEHQQANPSRDMKAGQPKRRSITDATSIIRRLVENNGSNRRIKRAQKKLDRVLLADSKRKAREGV